MITNKDIRVENGSLIINGDPYPLDGQSPEAIMQIVKDNSDTTPTENSTNPVESGGVFDKLKEIHPSADKLTAEVFESNSVSDIVIILNETGNDDYKGMIVKDKNGNERYRLYFTGGHVKFLSKAADGTTIVDTTLA